MKLSKIGSILKAKKRIAVFTYGNDQWIGDGHAFYCIRNMPYLEAENIYTMFDVPQEKQGKILFQQIATPQPYVWDDIDEDEKIITVDMFSILYKGGALTPIKTSQGIAFLTPGHLAPFSDEKNGYEIYERTRTDGSVYFVVKNGMFILGMIEAIKELPKDLRDQIKMLLELLV